MDEVRARVVDLDLNDVLPNRFQPRIKFSEDSIIELSESIKEHGVIQPIVVRPIADKFEIIAGERRYKASVLAGKETIPAIITDLNDKDSAEVALIENVQRKDLTAIEEAISYKKILDMGYLTQEQLAIKLGKSQSTVANKIRLLNLCDEVQEALMEDKISERHARSMLKLTKAEQQKQMLERIIKERLTVRKTDEEIEKMNTYITNNIEEPTTPVSNPGFVDVDKIANNAQDLQFEDPSGNVNINALLQGNVAANPAESTIPVIPTMEQTPLVTPVPTVDVAPSIPVVDLMAPAPVEPIAPVIPEVPVAPVEIPSVPVTEPIAPVVPEVTPVPTVDVAPTIPVVDLMAPASVEPVAPIVEPIAPVIPEVPVTTVVPTVPEMPTVTPVVPEIPVVAPVAPVVPEIPTVAPVEPVAPVVEPIAPVVSEVQTIPEAIPAVPTITPVAPPAIAPMPTTPIVEESLPSTFLSASEEPVASASETPAEPVTPVVEQTNELAEAEAKLDEPVEEIKPIIITDYTKQYDPVLPDQPVVRERVDFKQIINLIRDVNNTIEKCGYTIETEEYDLEGVYQVIFKINKD